MRHVLPPIFLALILLAVPASVVMAEPAPACDADLIIPMPFPEVRFVKPSSAPPTLVHGFPVKESGLKDFITLDYSTPPMKAGKGDGPQRITPTTDAPFSAVVHLYSEWNGLYYLCSGAFANDAGTILTAGHCVYNHDRGGFPQSIAVLPARDEDVYPFDYDEATGWAVTDLWIEEEDTSEDWALISVAPFEDGPNETGSFGLYVADAEDWYEGKKFQTAGYPGAMYEYTGYQMWWGEGLAEEIWNGLLKVDFAFGDQWPYYCISGQSGSPVYFENGEAFDTVGVLTQASCQGVVIDESIRDAVVAFSCEGCAVEGECVEEGLSNPQNPCEVCDPESAQVGWSPEDGVSCDDGLFCNGEDFCEDGECKDHEGSPCFEDETCDEDSRDCQGEGQNDSGDDDDDDGCGF